MRSKISGTDGSRTIAVQSGQISCDDGTAGSRRWSDTCGGGSTTFLGGSPDSGSSAPFPTADGTA